MNKKKPSGRRSVKTRPPQTPIRNSYSIKQILKLRNELVEVLRFEYPNQIVRGDDFIRLVDLVYEQLSPHVHKLQHDVLLDSLSHLAGVCLTPELLEETCHRLAGNLPRLRARRKVTRWKVQFFPEWVPVQILSVCWARNNKQALGVVLTIKILAGTPCPLIVQQWWSVPKCRYLSSDFGFSRRHGSHSTQTLKYPYTTPEGLVNLRFSGLVDKERSEGEPVLTEIEFPTAIQNWNKAMIRRRFREGFKCPAGYPQTFPCFRCAIGYTRCPAATHRQNYVQQLCPQCGNEKAWFDPGLPVNMCVSCLYKTTHKPYLVKKVEDDDAEDD